MNYISIKHLKAIGACEDQTQKFREIFGESVNFDSLEEAQGLALKYAHEFDFFWIGYRVFKESYEEAEVLVWKVYEEAEATLLNAYEDAKAPLLKAYKDAKASWEAYQEAVDPLWKTYLEAKAPLWKTYEEGCARLFAKMWWDLLEGTKGYPKEYIQHD